MKTLLVLTTLVIVGHCLLEDILGNIQENKRSVSSIKNKRQISHILTTNRSESCSTKTRISKKNDQSVTDILPNTVRWLVIRRGYENTLNFLYRIADNNRNGRLSASELAQYTQPKDGKTPLENARETVRLCDTNNDHELTKTEMLTYLNSVGN